MQDPSRVADRIDPDELHSLADLGIAGLSVQETPVDKTIDGQTVFAEGSFEFEDGGIGSYFGVRFTSPPDSLETAPLEPTEFGSANGETPSVLIGVDDMGFGAGDF